MFRLIAIIIALTATASHTAVLAAHPYHRFCPACSAPCATYKTVERTIMVPQMTTQTQQVQVVECRPELRQRAVTTYQRIPQTRTVTRECVVMVPRQETRQVTRTVYKPVRQQVTRQYTVIVPHEEVRQGVHRVCKPTVVTETRTVCVDEGCWIERACAAVCGDPCCQRTTRVWEAKLVEKQIEVQVCRPQIVEQPYQYTVTVCKREVRTRTVEVCRYVAQQQTRHITCTRYVPTTVTKTFQQTSYKCVPVEQMKTYTVMIPHTVEKTIQVPVCQMVPKTVTCRVAVPCDRCQSCPPGCRGF